MANVDESVIAVLETAETDESTIRLTCGQLDRKTYQQTDKVLKALGGKWNRKTGAHVFDKDPRPRLELVLATGEFTDPKKELGFFETPPELAERLIRLADLTPEMFVLEPSAGNGAIADQVVNYVPAGYILCIDISPERCAVLRDKGFRVYECDFLEVPPRRYNRVIMNPPFPRQADIDHVLHAWEFVAPGGRLVSVMSAGVSFRTNRKTTEFRDLVLEHGRIEDNPDGSFKASGTHVRTVTIVMDKGAA